MAVTVKITETYDMRTTTNKLGLVGIHTPQATLLQKLYPGLMKNFKFMRLIKCDVVGACASVLPADPLQIGVTSGTVAPEDMFNPILYTAVSNESFDTLVARVRALTGISALGSVDAGNMVPNASADSNFKAYYALLSENGRFRKAMPQSGFKITGLIPLAHTVISTFGNVGPIGNTTVLHLEDDSDVEIPGVDLEVPTVDGNMSASTSSEIFYRGKAIKMPKIPLHVGMEDGNESPPNIPKTHVLMLALPPARLHEFYYRMRVTWTIRFENVVSTIEASTWDNLLSIGSSSRGSNYSYSSSKTEMENNEDMISSDGVEINKIMES